jgi:hypothetical protein
MTHENIYEKVDKESLARLTERHAWIVGPIYRASDAVLKMPFYEWVHSLKEPIDFKPAAIQLFHHSATFPKVMGLMLGTTPMSENHMMKYYSKHAYGEADHHEMLRDWMVRHKLLGHASEMDAVIPTVATNACVNLAYQLAIEADRYKWVLTINCGIERCSNDFFKAVAPKMSQIGAGDPYFDIHVEADEFHSIMGMEHLDPQDPNTIRGRHLIAKSLEGISLWAAMLHSWIGINMIPQFNLDGSVKQG